MNRVLSYKYYDTPEGHDIFLKTFAASKYAAFAGTVMGFYDVLMFSQPRTIGGIAGRFIWYVGPMVGITTGFTVTTNAARNIRNTDDKLNYFLGGAVAGCLFSAWIRAPIITVPAAVLFGFAGVVKKTSLQDNWLFFPDVVTAPKSIKSVSHDWTMAKDIEELKGYTTKAN